MESSKRIVGVVEGVKGGVEVTKLAVPLYAISIPTAVFSYLLLGEAITHFMVVGGILVVLGIILTQSG